MNTVNTIDVKQVEIPAPQEGPGAIRKTLGWGFTAVQMVAPFLGKFEKVAEVVSPDKLTMAGQAAAVGSGGLALEAHAKEIMKPGNTTADHIGNGVGMVGTALSVAATVGELAAPFAPAVAPFVPVIGQAAALVGYTGMAYNLGHAAYKAAVSA